MDETTYKLPKCSFVLENFDFCGLEECAAVHMMVDGHDFVPPSYGEEEKEEPKLCLEEVCVKQRGRHAHINGRMTPECSWHRGEFHWICSEACN